jgi:Holliday junction DNA helicase RuvA
MIGRLRGAVAEVGEEEALIDVMGVGYVVRCGSRTLSRLPALGEEALLHIESQWSESAGLRLYGFGTREDRKAFVLLQAIQGVGPRRPWRCSDMLSPAELASAVAREDKAAVGRASGVGPKLALRIVTELKDKPITDGPVFMGAPTTGSAPTPAKPAPTGDAVAALMGLGVAEVNARRVVEAAAAKLGEEATVQALIKAGLQELGR